MCIVKQKKLPSSLLGVIFYGCLFIFIILLFLIFFSYEKDFFIGKKVKNNKIILDNNPLLKENNLVNKVKNKISSGRVDEEKKISEIKNSPYFSDTQLDNLFDEKFKLKSKLLKNTLISLENLSKKNETKKVEIKKKNLIILKKKSSIEDKELVILKNKKEKKENIIKKIILKKEKSKKDSEKKIVKEENKILISENILSLPIISSEKKLSLELKKINPDIISNEEIKPKNTLEKFNNNNFEQEVYQEEFSYEEIGNNKEIEKYTEMYDAGLSFYDRIKKIIQKFPGRYKKITMQCTYEPLSKKAIIYFQNEKDIPYAYKAHITSTIQRNTPDSILYNKKLIFII